MRDAGNGVALGKRSGSLQDGAIVPSSVHPNIGSPRNAATLGEVGCAFSATHFRHCNQRFVCVSCIKPTKQVGAF